MIVQALAAPVNQVEHLAVSITRAKSFDDARGSTSESAACLDALVAKRICREERVREGKELLERVYAMLTKLIDRFDSED